MLFPSVGGYYLKNTESVGGDMLRNTDAIICFILFCHQFCDRSDFIKLNSKFRTN